jgi:ABC-type phosphate transport system substrate-binding protein
MSRVVCRRRLVPTCVISAAALAAMVAPGTAGATVGAQCSGENVVGQGAAVEKIAHQVVWGPGFNSSPDTFACNGKQGTKAKPTATYTSTGSGAGLKSWGANLKEGEPVPTYGLSNAFIGTSEAPSASQIAEIASHEETPVASDLETIPVSQLAIAVIVNLPSNCTANSTAAPGRLVFSDATLDGIWRGTIEKWSQITDGGDVLSGAGCNPETSIQRVGRQDQAGTTHILKRFLNVVNPASYETESAGTGTWNEDSEGALDLVWPKGGAGELKVITPLKKGDEEEALKVSSTPGSIGYGNLAEIRSTNLFSGAGGGPSTAKFWVELQHSDKKNKLTYADPASNKDITAPGNANCAKTVYTNGKASFPPPAITAPWNEVTTNTTQKSYALCGFIFVLAFKQYSAYAGTSVPEATTVNNYLRYILDKKGGQQSIAGHDYLALPKGKVLSEGISGAAAVGF